jgi:hypothetical protein
MRPSDRLRSLRAVSLQLYCAVLQGLEYPTACARHRTTGCSRMKASGAALHGAGPAMSESGHEREYSIPPAHVCSTPDKKRFRCGTEDARLVPRDMSNLCLPARGGGKSPCPLRQNHIAKALAS